MLDAYKENAKRFANGNGRVRLEPEEAETHCSKKIKLDEDTGYEEVDEQNRKIICMHAKFKKY